MGDLRFYELGGKQYPSVTSIIGSLDKGEGLMKWACSLGYDESRKVLGEASYRGRTVHRYINEWLLGKNAEDIGIDEKFLGYWKSFEKAALYLWGGQRPKAFKSELNVFCEKYGFAGQLDYVGDIDISRYDMVSAEIGLLDWKTSSSLRAEAGMQTIAYAVAWNELHPKTPVQHRLAVRLGKDGEFNPNLKRDLKWYPRADDAVDFVAFLGLRDAFAWKYRNKFILGDRSEQDRDQD